MGQANPEWALIWSFYNLFRSDIREQAVFSILDDLHQIPIHNNFDFIIAKILPVHAIKDYQLTAVHAGISCAIRYEIIENDALSAMVVQVQSMAPFSLS